MVGSILEMVARALVGNEEGAAEGKESGDHYYAYRNLVECQGEIKRLLPTEMHEALARLGNEYNALYSTEKELCYRQGFSDAIRLIFDALS